MHALFASNMNMDYCWLGCLLIPLALAAPLVLLFGAARSFLNPAPISWWLAAFLLIEAVLSGYIATAYLRSKAEPGYGWLLGWGGIAGIALAPAIACRELAKRGWLSRNRL